MIEIALRKTLQGATTRLELDVEMKLADGEFTALFGPSGAGKTTLLRLLAGLERPDAGRIVVDGEVWFDADRRIDLPTRRRSIGLVFQDYALFPHWSVRDNIAYAAGKDDAGWIDELLDITGLEPLRQQLPPTLSGGQKQRVALARALARRPALLLLDEPLSALDQALRVQLQDQLAQLQRHFRCTTLMVSHDIGEVFRLSRQVHRLEHGRVIQSGTPSEVFLQRRMGGKIHLRGQVLAIRREDVVLVVSLLLGQDIVDVIASDDEVAGLQEGAFVSLAVKAFSPLIFR